MDRVIGAALAQQAERLAGLPFHRLRWIERYYGLEDGVPEILAETLVDIRPGAEGWEVSLRDGVEAGSRLRQHVRRELAQGHGRHRPRRRAEATEGNGNQEGGMNMAAERKAVSSKLKLVISYNDENDNLCEKSVQMRNLVNGADPANVVTAVNAIGTLYEDPITGIHEVVENEITA